MEFQVLTTDGRDDNAAKQRLAILNRNRELIEHQFVQATDKDIAFVMWELTPKTTLPDDVKQFVVRSIESNLIPTQVIQGPRWALYKALRSFQRGLHRIDPRDPKESRLIELLARPAKPNHFWAVVIACRGKQVVEFPAPISESQVQP
jgi:hypothetical protein